MIFQLQSGNYREPKPVTQLLSRFLAAAHAELTSSWQGLRAVEVEHTVLPCPASGCDIDELPDSSPASKKVLRGRDEWRTLTYWWKKLVLSLNTAPEDLRSLDKSQLLALCLFVIFCCSCCSVPYFLSAGVDDHHEVTRAQMENEMRRKMLFGEDDSLGLSVHVHHDGVRL